MIVPAVSSLSAYKHKTLYNIDSRINSPFYLGLLYSNDRYSSNGGMVTTLLEPGAPTCRAALPGVAFFYSPLSAIQASQLVHITPFGYTNPLL